MSSDTCKHGNYYRNCRQCILDRQEERGKRDSYGILHSDNGSGWCVGHIEHDPRWPDGDGRCTVLVRHCPVLNTPKQLTKNLREDAIAKVEQARARVEVLRLRLEVAEERHKTAQRELEVLING